MSTTVVMKASTTVVVTGDAARSKYLCSTCSCSSCVVVGEYYRSKYLCSSEGSSTPFCRVLWPVHTDPFCIDLPNFYFSHFSFHLFIFSFSLSLFIYYPMQASRNPPSETTTTGQKGMCYAVPGKRDRENEETALQVGEYGVLEGEKWAEGCGMGKIFLENFGERKFLP